MRRATWLLILGLVLPAACPAQALFKHLAHSGYDGPFMDARDIDRADLLDARHLARLGDVPAQYNTGAMYHALGRHDHAIYWYRRAELFGHPLAAYNLGLLFYEGAPRAEARLAELEERIRPFAMR